MSTQLKLRRGTTAQHSTFTGAAGEVTVDTTKKTVVVHDGTTAGGVPLQKEAFQQSGTGATVRTVDAKLKDWVNVKDFGASSSNTAAQNKTALQTAIAAVDAAGGGYVMVPWDCPYGYKRTSRSTWPDLTGITNSVTVMDLSKGDTYTSPSIDGPQIRWWFKTTSNAVEDGGMHDGNGHWIRGRHHPYLFVSNDTQATGTVKERRAGVLTGYDGIASWAFGQGTKAGDTYTDDQLMDFRIAAFNNYGGGSHPDGTNALVIERTTGNFGFNSDPGGFGYNFTALSSAGSGVAVFKASGSTNCEVFLRNSNGSADDIRLKNTAGDFNLVVNGSQDFTVTKANARYGFGVSPSYKLDVSESRASNFVVNFKNTSSTNGYITQWTSASTGAATWNFLEAYSANGGDLEFKLSGAGNGTCDGSWTGGGADYAEYFEWEDGNPDGEDRRGFAVSLVGNKIKKAEPGEQVIGVVSGNPSVVGDAAALKWSEKYLKDDFGTYLTEPCEVWSWDEQVLVEPAQDAVPAQYEKRLVPVRVRLGESDIEELAEMDVLISAGRDAAEAIYKTVKHSYEFDKIPEGVVVPDNKEVTVVQRRVLNPAYDPNAKYVPREARKEWDCVGLMGKLRVRKGQVVGDRWVKMRDVSASVEEWLVR